MIKTLQVDTKGQWEKADEIFDITLVNDAFYSLQVLGLAFMSYSSSLPDDDCFTINFPQPFTYEKKSGQDLYIKTAKNENAIITIAG